MHMILKAEQNGNVSKDDEKVEDDFEEDIEDDFEEDIEDDVEEDIEDDVEEKVQANRSVLAKFNIPYD
jgi:hypothetical protein